MSLGDAKLQTLDTFYSATSTSLTVGTSAVEAKVGASPLSDRQMIRVYNDSNNIIYFGYTSGVTTAGSTRGEPIFKNQFVQIMLTDQQSLYLIAGSAGNGVIVSEFA